jgi:GR25 family glycosyltransferase involved in LPS biosynthesis
MEKIDRLYFINLNRREDRKNHFLNECVKTNIPMNKVCRVEAIDGLLYNFHRNELTMFSNADFLIHPDNIIKKIMGNQLSHYYLLKEIIRENLQFTIICQDDAVFIPNFMDYIDNVTSNLPTDAELINIGLHKEAEYSFSSAWNFNIEGNDNDKISKQVVNEYVCKMKPELNPCSLAYILTLEGAKNIVQHFEMNGFKYATDYNFNEYLINKDIFYSSSTILVTGNPQLGSDIFKV